MSALETISTDGMAPHKRVEFWNSAASETLIAESASPLNPGAFFGCMRRADLGDLRLAELTSDAATVVHSKAHVSRSREAVFLLRIQLAGESTSYQNGREVTLRPGDFTLCDSARPYELSFTCRASVLTLRIPKEVLRRRIANPENIVLIPMSGAGGPSALTSKCVQEFWHAFGDLFDAGLVPRFSNVMLDLIASSYAVFPIAKSDRTSLAVALRVRILDYIEQHLFDFELTPTSIAATFKITPRYLHLLFAGGERTVGQHILHRRLGKSRQALQDPLLHGRSVSCIAYENGFKSVQHFCKAFRECYGVAPGDFRRSSLRC